MSGRFEDLARFCGAARAGGSDWPPAAARFAAAHGAALGRELLRTLTLFYGIPPLLRALDEAAEVLAARDAGATVPAGEAAARGRAAFARVYGPDAEPVLARLGELDPLLRSWVLEHAYGRGYQDGLLELVERERLAVLALADTGCWKQCDSHLRACRRLGVDDAALRAGAAAGGWLGDAARAELLRRIGSRS